MHKELGKNNMINAAVNMESALALITKNRVTGRATAPQNFHTGIMKLANTML